MFATGDTVAEKYRIERLLGRGGMGAVYAAEHLLLEQRVAIKVIAADLAGPGHKERFLREARAASRVRSEHVTQVFDVGQLADGTIYMVLELLDGHDLAETRRRGLMEPAEGVALVLEALVGVAAAHASGVIHRDLKLENLFVARRPNGSLCVKVLDFGISKSLGEAKSITASGTMVGSPYSMSPEQIRDAKSVDARTDVWSMGVVLYVLLTGEEPFDGDDVGAVLASILEARPKPVGERRPGLDAGLDAVVARALAKDRAARFQNVADLAEALAPFAGDRGAALAVEVRRALGVSGTATIDPAASRKRQLSASDPAMSKTTPSEALAALPSGEAKAASGPVASEVTPPEPKRRSDATVAGVPFERTSRPSPLLWVGILAGFAIAGIAAVFFGSRASTPGSAVAVPDAAPPSTSAPLEARALVTVAEPSPTATSSPPGVPTSSASSAPPVASSLEAPPLHGHAPSTAVGASAKLPGGHEPTKASSAPSAPPAPAVPAAPSNDVLFNQGRQ